MLPQYEKLNDLKGSKPASVLFLVELMRLDMQTVSEKHVKVVPGLLTLTSQLAQVPAPAVASLTSPVKHSQNAGAWGWEPDWKDWVGHSCSIAGWAGMTVGLLSTHLYVKTLLSISEACSNCGEVDPSPAPAPDTTQPDPCVQGLWLCPV